MGAYRPAGPRRGHDPGRRRGGPRAGVVVPTNTAGAAPVLMTGPDSAWSRALEKLIPHPPPAVFGVVRTAPFALTGIALWLARRSDANGRRTAPALSVLQRVSTSRGRPASSHGGTARRNSASSSRCGPSSSGPSRPSTGSAGGPRHRSSPTSCRVVFAALNYQFRRPNGHESPPGIISFRR